MMRTRLIVLLAGLGLAACGPQPQSTSNAASQSRLFDTQRDAMDKAKGVNETVMQGDQALRAQEEAQAK
jgi:hypothetical protein